MYGCVNKNLTPRIKGANCLFKEVCLSTENGTLWPNRTEGVVEGGG